MSFLYLQQTIRLILYIKRGKQGNGQFINILQIISNKFCSFLLIIIKKSKERLRKMATNNKWRQQEIQMLRQLKNEQIQANQNNWNIISQKLSEVFTHMIRTPKQCRQKYVNCARLSQDESQNQWSLEEFELLMKYYIIHGPKWALISKQFPNKSQNNIKNKFNNRIRKSASLLNEIEGKIYKNTKKTIDYELLAKIIGFISQLEKSIKEVGNVINPNNRFFLFRTNMLKLSFTSESFDNDRLIEIVKDIKKLNRDIRSYGVFKAKNIKHWKLQKINFNKICQKEEVMLIPDSDSAIIVHQESLFSSLRDINQLESSSPKHQSTTLHQFEEDIFREEESIFENMIGGQESILNLDFMLYH